ncbi:MAG: FAD-binding oxidoreductase [Frankiaceae bacterium]|nr:FAD-binding oxidoreductase [Frankiaceae bacterium]
MTDISTADLSVVRTSPLAGFTGVTWEPGEPGYDEVRHVFNGMVDRRPALIARCTSADDVSAAVRHAVAVGLPVSVYGGGHSVTGVAVVDGGLCIDLRGMKSLDVDPGNRTVRAGAGLTWGELDAACQEHGLAVTGGRVSSTGVAGLALGSGSGWLERAFGFTCDNLLSAEVVTAEGRQVTASPTSNPDLFWGLRGGGGNFGIVTEFVLRLHPVGPIVLGGLLMYPAQQAQAVTRAWRDLMLAAPDALGTGLAFITAPPADFVPEPVRGLPVIGVIVCWSGPVEDGRAALAPLTDALPPAIDMVQPMPYVAVQQLIDAGNPPGMRNYWSGDFFEGLPDEAIDTFIAKATAPVSPLTSIILTPGRGAIARVPEDATAFGTRDAAFQAHYLGMWADPADDERNIAAIRSLATDMKPWTTGTAYLNFLGDEGQQRIADSFGAEKYARLRELKQTWDPTNLFRHNQNIPPAD